MKLPVCVNDYSDSKIVCFHDHCLSSNKTIRVGRWVKIVTSKPSVTGYQHKILVTFSINQSYKLFKIPLLLICNFLPLTSILNLGQKSEVGNWKSEVESKNR